MAAPEHGEVGDTADTNVLPAAALSWQTELSAQPLIRACRLRQLAAGLKRSILTRTQGGLASTMTDSGGEDACH